MKKIVALLMSFIICMTLVPIENVQAEANEYSENMTLTYSKAFTLGADISEYTLSGYDDDSLYLESEVRYYDKVNERTVVTDRFDHQGTYWLTIAFTFKNPQNYTFKTDTDTGLYDGTVTLNGKTTIYQAVTDNVVDANTYANGRLEILYPICIYDEDDTPLDSVTFTSSSKEYIADGDGLSLAGITSINETNCVLQTVNLMEATEGSTAYVVIRAKDDYQFKGMDNNGVVEYKDIFQFGTPFDTSKISGLSYAGVKAYVANETGVSLFKLRFGENALIEENDLIISYPITQKKQAEEKKNITITLQDTSVTEQNKVHVGKKAASLTISGAEGYNVQLIGLDENESRSDYFTHSGKAYVGVILSQKNSSETHFEKDENYAYTGKITVNGKEIEDVKVGEYETNSALGSGLVCGEHYGKDLFLKVEVDVIPYTFTLYEKDGTLYTTDQYDNNDCFSVSEWHVNNDNTVKLTNFYFETTADKALILSDDLQMEIVDVEDCYVDSRIATVSEGNAKAIAGTKKVQFKGEGYLEVSAEKSANAIGVEAIEIHETKGTLCIQSSGIGTTGGLVVDDGTVYIDSEKKCIAGLNSNIYSKDAGLVHLSSNEDVCFEDVPVELKDKTEMYMYSKNSSSISGLEISGTAFLQAESENGPAFKLTALSDDAVMAAVDDEDGLTPTELVLSEGYYVPMVNGESAHRALITDSAKFVIDVTGETEFKEKESEDISWHISGVNLDEIYDSDDDPSNGYSDLAVYNGSHKLNYGTDYTLEQGSIVVKVNKNYLNTLSGGKYNLKLKFDHDYESYELLLPFTVLAPYRVVNTSTR